MMASIFCSAISFRAFSRRPRRSAAVIGLAFERIDVNASMLGGSGPVAAAPPRGRWAETRVTGTPAAAPASERKCRREIIKVSVGRCRVSSRGLERGARAAERDTPAGVVECGEAGLHSARAAGDGAVDRDADSAARVALRENLTAAGPARGEELCELRRRQRRASEGSAGGVE